MQDNLAKVLAVSGGIDSMVMLHQFRSDKDVVVAHFNHKMRASADDDAEFVKRTAQQYGLRFEYGEAKTVLKSEADAREARYGFLRKVADDCDGQIYTAHHTQDLIESITINLIRGTGWRGLTPFSDFSIRRPFLEQRWGKAEIYRYATKHQVVFRQDPTNNEGAYLRNRIRTFVAQLPRERVDYAVQLYGRQLELRQAIEHITDTILPTGNVYRRAWFKTDDDVTLELVRNILARHSIAATRPQMMNFIEAIRSYENGKCFNLPNDRLIKFGRESFTI